MQDHDPLSPGHIGAALAVAGLAALMLGETPSSERIAAAACCLVTALAAFAIAGLRRPARRPPRRAAAPARGPTVPIRVPADITLPGQWSMPLSQRDPLVHAALSMPARRFQSGDPPAGTGEADRRATLAEMRARRIADQD